MVERLDVQRYREGLVEVPSGRYVRYSDYAALEARCAELEKELQEQANITIKAMKRIAEQDLALRDRIEREPVVKLGRFGHHPDPAIDFEVEVQSLEARLIDAKNGYAKIGTEPESVETVMASIRRAMEFRVGADPITVAAKQLLRAIEKDAETALASAPERVEAEPVNLPDKFHQFAVTSTDYARPYLLGCYATLDAALKAQGGKPEKWDIFVRYASPPAPVVTDAEKLAAEIEQRFPNWRGFRDLIDCIDVTLHELRAYPRFSPPAPTSSPTP